MRREGFVGRIVALAICLACARMAGAQSGIVSYWPLDEGFGTAARDVFGPNNGTLVNAPAWVTGHFGSGLSFDRTNRYVDLPVAIANSMRGSVSFWINTTQDFSLPPDMAGHVFYGTETNGDGYGGQNELHVSVENGSNSGRIRYSVQGNPNVRVMTPSTPRYNDGVWHHVVTTWDWPGNAIVYVDGAQRISGANTANPFVCVGGIRLGYAMSATRFYSGLLDDVRLYNRALTAGDVTALFGAGPTLPIGRVTRTLTSALMFSPGAPMTVRLQAIPQRSGEIVTTETVPSGLTPVIVGTPAGTASVVGQTIRWRVTLGSTTETLTYQVTPAVGPTELTFAGTFDAGPGWMGLATGGDTKVFGGLAVGIFDWHGNIGIDPLGLAGGDPSTAGNATFGGGVYTITGAGTGPFTSLDRAHVAAKNMSMDFALDATVQWTSSTSPVDVRAGLMVRDSLLPLEAMAYVGIRNPSTATLVVLNSRPTERSVVASAAIVPGAQPEHLRIVRRGILATAFRNPGSGWVQIGNVRTLSGLDGDVAACLFVSSNASGVDAVAQFSGVTLTPLVIQSATRDIQATSYTAGQPIHVAIDVRHLSGGAPFTVTEQVPAGWSISNVVPSGTVTGTTVTWSRTAATTQTALAYDATPVAGQPIETFSGFTSEAGIRGPVLGDTFIRRAGAKVVLYIRAAAFSEYDANIENLLGPAGVKVWVGATSVTVPGLGYGVVEVIEGADLPTYTKADGDLLFISQSPGSANLKYHTDDPIPIVITETASFSGGVPDRTRMYFSDVQGAGVGMDFNIITSHPIVAAFPMGITRMSLSGNMGTMRPTIASAVTVLAVSPTTPTWACLAAADVGVSGFRPGGWGNDPAPARRVCLGIPELPSMGNTSMTVAGVILFQRCAQWAMGELSPPLAPTAPTSLTVTALGLSMAQLDWHDNSLNESGFKIERKTSGTLTFTEIAQVTANTTTYQDNSLSPGVVYVYRIRAFNPVGVSAYSNEAIRQLASAVRRWQMYR